MSIHELPRTPRKKTGGILEKMVMHGVDGLEPETKVAEGAGTSASSDAITKPHFVTTYEDGTDNEIATKRFKTHRAARRHFEKLIDQGVSAEIGKDD